MSRNSLKKQIFSRVYKKGLKLFYLHFYKVIFTARSGKLYTVLMFNETFAVHSISLLSLKAFSAFASELQTYIKI